MKKLAILTLAFMATMTVNAASFKWQSGIMYRPDGDGAATTTQVSAGQVVGYYFTISASDYASETYLSGIASQIEAGTFSTTGSASGKITAAGALNRAVNWDQTGAAVDDKSYVLAVYFLEDYLDQDWYVINTATLTIPGSGADATGQNIANSIINTQGWSPVPEPTSMALLALGTAVLGLRRRFRK